MRALLFFALFACGCVATPLPDPPSLDAMYVAPTSSGPLQIDGMAGAVDPEATIAAVSLDGTDPFTRVSAAADGGFSIVVPGFVFDVVRMHVELDGARSEPIDFVATGGTPMAAVPPLASCLSIPLAIDTGDTSAGATRTIGVPIENDCAGDVTIDAIALRAPLAGATIVTPAPLVIATGSSATIEVELAPPSAGALEEVLLVSIAAPEAGRRAVTLYGQVR
jgi:hypothetical protein